MERMLGAGLDAIDPEAALRELQDDVSQAAWPIYRQAVVQSQIPPG